MTATLTSGVDEAARRIAAVSAHTDEVLADLPAPVDRTRAQQEVAAAAKLRRRQANQQFLSTHAAAVYARLTEGRLLRPRLSELLAAAAAEFPGLVPSAAAMAAEQDRVQAAKEGLEIDHGLFTSWVLREPTAGEHLMESMLQPTERALALLPAYLRDGELILRSVHLVRRNGAAHLTMIRDDCLNAEDNQQVDDLETAVDLALLDPDVRVAVLRGGEMTHSRYAGKRVFSAGVNLKALHAGKISYADFFMRRELGYLNKIVRGIAVEHDGGWRGPTVQKPWLAAVDTFAIGGGAQLVLLFDHVVAAADAYFSLPAAQEGIVPGAANLRLTRAVGARLARRIILWGERVDATSADAGLLFDEVVDPAEMDRAVEEGVRKLDNAAVVTNRRMLNLAEESPEACRHYFAEFALQQALRLYSEDVLGKISRFTTQR